MTKTLTDAELLELAKLPEFRAEMARNQAKTAIHLDALVAEAIRAAVKQDRVEADALLEKRLSECFCEKEPQPCAACMEVARIRGALLARPER